MQQLILLGTERRGTRSDGKYSAPLGLWR